MVSTKSDCMRIGAVGDIIFADQQLCFGFGVRSRFPGGTLEGIISDAVGGLLAGHDFCIGNLECGMDDDAELSLSNNVMAAPSALVRALKENNIGVFTVANNHTLEHGERGVPLLKRRALENGVRLAGFPDISCEIDFHGHNVRIMSYTDVPDYKNTKTIGIWKGDASLAEIREAARGCELLIVCVHWGSEFMNEPSPSQVSIAHSLVDAGAGVVIGTHPHVLQPIEQYNGGVVFYSLGNFITDYYWDPCLLSAVASICVKFMPGSKPEISYDCQPVKINKDSYLVDLATGDDAAKIKEILSSGVAAWEPARYMAEVARIRMEYRRVSLVHVLRNAFRFRDCPGFLAWFFGRVWHFIRYYNIEKKDPGKVYA